MQHFTIHTFADRRQETGVRRNGGMQNVAAMKGQKVAWVQQARHQAEAQARAPAQTGPNGQTERQNPQRHLSLKR